MGHRAYLFIDLVQDVVQKEYHNLVSKINNVEEVDFVDTIQGSHDMVAMVEVPVSFSKVIDTIKGIDGVRNVETCKIIGTHKEW